MVVRPGDMLRKGRRLWLIVAVDRQTVSVMMSCLDSRGRFEHLVLRGQTVSIVGKHDIDAHHKYYYNVYRPGGER